jgi:hypothetical protein
MMEASFVVVICPSSSKTTELNPEITFISWFVPASMITVSPFAKFSWLDTLISVAPALVALVIVVWTLVPGSVGAAEIWGSFGEGEGDPAAVVVPHFSEVQTCISL